MLHSQSSLCEAGDQSPSLHSTQIQLNILNHIYYINILTFPGCFQFSLYSLLSNNNTTTGRVDNRLIFQISLIFISYISLSTFIHLIIYLQHVTEHIKSIQSILLKILLYMFQTYATVINDTLSKVLSIIYILRYVFIIFFIS